MLRYAALSMAFALIALLVMIFGNLVSGVLILLAKIVLWIAVPLFIIFLAIDLVQRHKNGRLK